MVSVVAKTLPVFTEDERTECDPGPRHVRDPRYPPPTRIDIVRHAFNLAIRPLSPAETLTGPVCRTSSCRNPYHWRVSNRHNRGQFLNKHRRAKHYAEASSALDPNIVEIVEALANPTPLSVLDELHACGFHDATVDDITRALTPFPELAKKCPT